MLQSEVNISEQDLVERHGQDEEALVHLHGPQGVVRARVQAHAQRLRERKICVVYLLINHFILITINTSYILYVQILSWFIKYYINLYSEQP